MSRTQQQWDNDRLLTPIEAADLLGVRVQTLAVWRSTNRYPIPYVRVGTYIRYRRSDLERWLDSRTERPSTV